MNFDISYFKKFNNKVALIDVNNIRYSYSDFVLEIKKLHKKFIKNSLVLMVVSNSFESFIGYFSFLDKSKNCTTIIIDESFGNEYFNKIIKKYKPKYLFYPSNFSIAKKIPTKSFIYKKYILSQTKNLIDKKINHKNFILISSSGTTGNPKFIRLTRKNITTNAASIVKSLNISSKHKTITTMPMGYSYGLSIINSHILSGATITINQNTIFEKKFWEKLKENEIYSFAGVPQFYEFLKNIKFHLFNLPKLKYITVAGGHLDLNIKKYFISLSKKKKIKFFTMYGQAEAAPRISCLNPALNPSKINSIGRPINGVKLLLIDNKNKQIKKTNKNGEILVLGKNVCLGYARKYSDLYKGDENNSSLKTGDIGYFDRQNYFYIIGRKKKISKIFGIRIDLNDIEKFLKVKNIISLCEPNNKKLIVKIMNNYDKKIIRNLINKRFKINKNYIEINKVKILKKNNFKKVI